MKAKEFAEKYNLDYSYVRSKELNVTQQQYDAVMDKYNNPKYTLYLILKKIRNGDYSEDGQLANMTDEKIAFAWLQCSQNIKRFYVGE